MDKEEKKEYQKLTKTQKEFIKILKGTGFKWKYFSTYNHIKYGDIRVDSIRYHFELLETFYQIGRIAKQWEVQQVLGIS